MFSVKGEDLLFPDDANRKLDEDCGRLRDAGLEAAPFASVGFFAPPTPDDLTGRPHVVGRTSGVSAFWWTLAEFCSGELLPYVFADAEDERNQYTMVIHQVAARLRREAVATGHDGAVTVEGHLLRTYDDLIKSSRPADRRGRPPRLGGPGHRHGHRQRLPAPAAVESQAAALDRPRRPAVRGPSGGDDRGPAGHGDRSAQPARARAAVRRRCVLADETARKEAAGAGGLLFTMLDELNKYAPREGGSPIKEVLLDIAERGRSLGIILIGAQQTASEVERRIVSNSSIKVVGRLDPAEAGRPEYGFLPPSQRARAVLAKPGTMFVSQPEIPVPLAVEFPFPAWATRESEMGAAPVVAGARNGVTRDPFARLPAVDDDIPF